MHASVEGAGIKLSAYPALMLFAGLATGIWIEHALPISGLWIWIGLAAAGTLSSWISGRVVAGGLVSLTRLNRYALAVLVAMSVGGMRLIQFNTLDPLDVSRLLRHASEQDVLLFGRTIGTPVEKDGRARFFLRVDSVLVGGLHRPRVARGKVYVTVGDAGTGAWIDGARAGSHIAVAGVLREARPPRNPADFNFRRHLLHRGVRSTLWAEDEAAISPVGPPHSVVRKVAVRVERQVEHALQQRVPTDEARAVLYALLLGRRNEIDDETLGHFSRTGLMHVLAVSGLHVLMVGMIVYGLLCPILLRFGLRWRAMEVARASVTLGLLLIYAVVTGGSASVTRAVVMAGVLIGGVSLQRTAPTINSLALAGSILLIQRPTYLWDIGFQLSFAAVAAIVLMQKPLQHFLEDFWDDDSWQARLAQGLTTTTAATLGTAPILLYHFGSVSLAGLLLNPLAIPATGLALSSGLLTVVTQGVTWMSTAFGQSADVFAHMLTWTASTGDDYLGWARIETRVTYPPYVLALVLAVACIVVMHVPRARWMLVIALVSSLSVGFWYDAVWGDSRPRFEVLFLDVGQGDAAILRFPNGRFMIVDAGPVDERIDAGARVVLPNLQWMGASRLEAALITHPHADHLGGLPSLIRGFPIGRVITNGAAYESSLVSATDAVLDSAGIAVQPVSVGDTIHIDDDVRMYVLAPSAATRSNPDPNEQSIVLRVEYGRTSFLFMGDAERASETHVFRHFRDRLPAQVVKVGHHGSRTSSFPPLVREVSLDSAQTIAVVSVAERNRFGLPDEEILDRWSQENADVQRTSEQGAIWIRSDGENVEVLKWRTE